METESCIAIKKIVENDNFFVFISIHCKIQKLAITYGKIFTVSKFFFTVQQRQNEKPVPFSIFLYNLVCMYTACIYMCTVHFEMYVSSGKFSYWFMIFFYRHKLKSIWRNLRIVLISLSNLLKSFKYMLYFHWF